MDIFDLLPVFAGPMILTIPVASLLCHYRVSRGQRVSYGTMFASASSLPLLLALVLTCINPSMWWAREGKNSPNIWLEMFLFMAAMCVVPAFVVVVYYRSRRKKDETLVT